MGDNDTEHNHYDKGGSIVIYEKLAKIQATLKAPKNQFNSFGKYNYRSCEDILEAVKPLLDGLVLTVSDEIVLIGDRYYVRATATLTDGKEGITNPAYAREEDNKKGMDASQLTGATSSYARKYALAGLFLLDDNKDSDATNDHGKGGKDLPTDGGKKDPSPPPAPPPDTDALREEMAKWVASQGLEGMDKFKELTGGRWSNPLDIKEDKNVKIAYKKFKEVLNA